MFFSIFVFTWKMGSMSSTLRSQKVFFRHLGPALAPPPAKSSTTGPELRFVNKGFTKIFDDGVCLKKNGRQIVVYWPLFSRKIRSLIERFRPL